MYPTLPIVLLKLHRPLKFVPKPYVGTTARSCNCGCEPGASSTYDTDPGSWHNFLCSMKSENQVECANLLGIKSHMSREAAKNINTGITRDPIILRHEF